MARYSALLLLEMSLSWGRRKNTSRRRLERDGARCEWRQDKTIPIRTNYIEENPEDSIGRGFLDNSHQRHCLAGCCPIVVVHSSTAYCAKVPVAGIATGLGMLVRYRTRHRCRNLDGRTHHGHLFGHSRSRHSYTEHCHTHSGSTAEGRG